MTFTWSMLWPTADNSDTNIKFLHVIICLTDRIQAETFDFFKYLRPTEDTFDSDISYFYMVNSMVDSIQFRNSLKFFHFENKFFDRQKTVPTPT